MDKIPLVGPISMSTTMMTTTATAAARPTTSRSLTTTAIRTTNVSSASATTSIRQYGTSKLKHVPISLDSDLRKASFKQDASKILRALGFEGWSPLLLKVEKVSGSLTNAVFFVHHTLSSQTVLLRIYGPCTSSLISRKNELHMLHVLSTRYGIAPRVFGTFVNGRIEEYFDSTPLSPREMRDPVVSQNIGKQMRELHSVDPRAVLLPQENGDDVLAEEVGVRRNVKKWMSVAKRVAENLREGDDGERIRAIDLEKFEKEWEDYWSWLMNWEHKHGKSERVFAHNDTQYGNLLKLRNSKTMEIIVVDFEYASINAVAFDIGNHFQEWMADYHSPTPHEMQQDKYPTTEERYNFYRGYGIEEDLLEDMDESVKAWSRASEGMWAVWGVVQAQSPTQMPTERESGDGDFDYIGYALSRMLRFRTATY